MNKTVSDSVKHDEENKSNVIMTEARVGQGDKE